MVRTARFSEHCFIEAATHLVAEGGPAAATMQAIARRVGAPTGSIYHRFESRSAILSAAWNAAYASFTGALAPLLREGRAREAALAILPWSSKDEHRARFLLLHEPVTLFEDAPPPAPVREELERLEEAFDSAFRACVAARGDGSVREEELARARFLIFDAPIAIIRPHLLKGGPLPPFVERMIDELHAGLPIAATPDQGIRPMAAA
ncbi:putative transcriptional regulator, TetR family protein [Siccirubricoccus deserti]|uniref:Helix-turn-helix transcriptional regulator n=1 Tax=Siccirubricoccus deserti TaxID=2013562 RepID=A0A9X0QW72_9PROT|nr:TetR/AcrR family transcriptional regulator [Siccirubricoccus deserti]MBC4015036.1 helix-turn-helix transcriptional regulator [Siccirubricoccus deserti]GGC36112.1 putative transcriptional regulator, TetR family protein [Siccirubricoccus deserti]